MKCFLRIGKQECHSHEQFAALQHRPKAVSKWLQPLP